MGKTTLPAATSAVEQLHLDRAVCSVIWIYVEDLTLNISCLKNKLQALKKPDLSRVAFMFTINLFTQLLESLRRERSEMFLR